MNTAIIDRTLSFLPISPEHIEKNSLLKYIENIFKCGADYVEIGSDIVKVLGDIDYSERYIFKIRKTTDMALAVNRRFAYVTIPVQFVTLFSKQKNPQNIIAEIFTNEYAVLSELLRLKNYKHLNSISLIRLTGIVSSTQRNIESLLSWYKANFFIPLDICPINSMLTGTGDAIGFLKAGVDSISLSFGRNHFYTALEDFLINMHILKRTPMPPETISAVCSASLEFLKIFGTIPSGMERIAEKDNPSLAPVYNIENGMVFRPFKPSKKANSERPSVIERQIKTIGLEREIEDAILEMLKKTNYSFYQNIIKRNIID